MTRKVEISVDHRGRITTDMIGFPGLECDDEAEVFMEILEGLGVRASRSSFRRKTESEIAAERGEAEEEDVQRGVKTR